jgi:pyruvate/2-oxoglutarate dehydrogenase complex dihydrolipoamide acyltransferase (E2) component
MKPTLGLIVKFFAKGQTSAALVARVLDENAGLVNLQVFNGGKDGTTLVSDVLPGQPPKDKVWFTELKSKQMLPSAPAKPAPKPAAAPLPPPPPPKPAPAPEPPKVETKKDLAAAAEDEKPSRRRRKKDAE